MATKDWREEEGFQNTEFTKETKWRRWHRKSYTEEGKKWKHQSENLNISLDSDYTGKVSTKWVVWLDGGYIWHSKGKGYHAKVFKTKTKALAYAKAYMRKH